MKIYRKFKFILLLLLITSILSCSSDDNEVNQNPELFGIWQRSDFIENPDFNTISENHDYRLYLYSDNTSRMTHAIYFDFNTGISTVRSLDWSTNGNQLKLVLQDEEEIITPYSINSEGQLEISGFSSLPFNRLE